MRKRSQRSRSGQVSVLFAISLIVVAAMCVFIIDFGLIYVSYAQLQNAVDAAALAGASELVGVVDEGIKETARSEAVALAAENEVAGDPLTLHPTNDVEFGYFRESDKTFIPESEFVAGDVVDSIRVRGRRNEDADCADGPVPLFFGPVFDWDTQSFNNVTAVGTQPRRYVVFALDRSGSMCYDTEDITYKWSPQSDYSWSPSGGPPGYYMLKSPSGWYWFPRRYYYSYWRTAYFCARDDATGAVLTGSELDWLPDVVKDNLLYDKYFRYRSYDSPSTVQSGWLKVPADVTIYARYDSYYWSAQSYGPISSCDYAMTDSGPQPLGDTQVAACAFVDLLRGEDDRAALVTFARNATLDMELTDQWEALKDKIMMFTPREATATPHAMEEALDELLESGRAEGYGHKIIILLTDGNANTLNGYYYDNYSHTYTFLGQSVTCYVHPTVGAAMEAQTVRARDNGVRIYTVTFGDGGETVLSPLIAYETSGAYYYAIDSESLTEIFIDIFSRLPAIITQ